MSFDIPRRLRSRRHLAEELRDGGRPVGRHDGNAQAFLRSHDRDCSRYDRATRTQRHQFARAFLKRIADTRTLWGAVQHLVRQGNKAPGPNGQRLKTLLDEHPAQVWAELRRLRKRLLDGSYVPGAVKQIWIPKTSGHGQRPIELANWQDLVVQRAIVQIIQPFLDPQFDELSLGYRPGRSRTEALARAELIARRHGRMVWIAADLKDAFTAVPHDPLKKALYEMLGERPLVRLIRRIFKANGRTRGVAQGGPLSPLLLNGHLHRSLDRPRRQCHPEIPLIRVADDLLLLCQSVEEAHHAYQDLQRILQPTGMRLKGNPPSDISDLGAQQTVEWLGYVMTLTQGVLTVRLSSRFMAKLQQRLQRELAESDGALRIGETLRGVVDQLGPCYPHEDPVRVIRLLIAAAQHIGVEELPSPDEFLSIWRRAHVRYLAHHDLLSRVPVTPTTDHYGTGQGSAAGHRAPADLGRGGTNDTSRMPHMSSAVSIDQLSVLVTGNACLPSGIGGWAFHLSPGGTQRSSVESGVSQRTTRHRMELVAVIRGLRQLPSGTDVELVTGSQYVADGIVRSQTLLQRSGGRRVASGPTCNLDLWGELYDLLGAHCVRLRLDGGVSDPAA